MSGSLYKLDTFYGDSGLKNLIQHSKHIIEEIEKFYDIYVLTEDNELEEIIMELEEEEDKEKKDEITEKNKRKEEE